MEAIWLGNNFYSIRIDDSGEFYDFKYVLHYDRWYKNEGHIDSWPVVSLWKNTIEEICYIREITTINNEEFKQTNSYPKLKQEVIEWCNDVIGPHGVEWGIPRPNLVTHPSICDDRSDWIEFIGSTTSYGVYFRLKRHAMLFKLTWS